MSLINIKIYNCIGKILIFLVFVSLFNFSFCNINGANQSQEHSIKSIYDLTNKDLLSLLIVGCFGSIAVSAGGGGGIISMPIFLGLMHVPFSQAVTFSSAIILGGVICALMTNLLQHKRELPEYEDAILFLKSKIAENNLDHSFFIDTVNKASLIDINIVMFIAPLLTAGSLFGLTIGRYISNILSTIMLNILLIYVLKISIQKFYKVRKMEMSSVNNQTTTINNSVSISNLTESDDSNLKEKLKIILYLHTISLIKLENVDNSVLDQENESCEKSLIKKSIENFKDSNWKYWLCFLILCLFSIWISVLDSGILFIKGTFLHSTLWLISVLLLLSFPAIILPRKKLNLITSIINSQNRLMEFLNYITGAKLADQNNNLDVFSFINYKSLNNFINYFLANLEILLVGIIGGITGASGAILISAIFFTSQVDPSSIAANNSTCLIISTLTCFFTYIFEGRIYFDLALLMLSISILCTLIGKNIIDYFVRKYKLSSIIIGILIGMILFSLLHMNFRLFFLLKNSRY